MSTLPAAAADAAIESPSATPPPGRVRSLVSQFTPRFWVALLLTIAVLIFAFVGPVVSGIDDPDDIVGGLYAEPSAEAWLGTDNFGKDVFTQLVYGTRTSLIIGVIVTLSVGLGFGNEARLPDISPCGCST